MRKLFWSFTFLCALAIITSAQSFLAQKAFEEGTRHAQNGEYEAALSRYESALLFAEIEPITDEFIAKLRFNRGVCFYRLKQANEAVKDFKEAVKLSRGNYQKAFYALGMAENDLQNYGAAKKAFLKAIKLNKKDGEAWFDLAMVYLREQNFEAAGQSFRRAIENKTVNTADAHNNIGVILVFNRDFANAESEFKIALRESNGTSIEAANNLRLCNFYRRQVFENPVFAEFKFSLKNENQGEL